MTFLESVGSIGVTILMAGTLGVLCGTLTTQLLSFLSEEARRKTMVAISAAISLLVFVWLVGADTDAVIASSEGNKVADTVWGVTIAVGASALLFVAFNMLFNQVTKSFQRFSTGLGAVLGFVLFGLLDGNRLIQWVGPRESVATGIHDVVNHGSWSLLLSSLVIAGVIGALLGLAAGTVRERIRATILVCVSVAVYLGFLWGLFYADRIPVDTTVKLLWTPLIGALLVGAAGNVLSRLDQPNRVIGGTGAGAAIGLLVGGLLKTLYLPLISLVPLILWAIVLGAAGAGLSLFRGRQPLGGALLGTAAGWVIGTYVATKTGGPRVEAMINTAIPLALVGARLSWQPRPGVVEAARIDLKSRAWIFLSPAMGFIALGLLIPLLRTMYLSTLATHRDPETKKRVTEFVLFDNYKDIFTNPNSFSVSAWRDIFTSAPFEIGCLLVLVGLGAAFKVGRRSGNSFRGQSGLVGLAGVGLLFGAFYELRLLRTDSVETPVASWHYGYLVFFVLGGAALLFAVVTQLKTVSSGGISSAAFDLSGGHLAAIVIGVFLIGMAGFASFRGTLFNSLWWVFAVTVLSSAMGLAIAALADRAGFENLAKSIIFMPMAISFVGAGIIWRFMYIARPDSDIQTGVLNFVWLELADMSQGSGFGRTLTLVVLAGLLLSLLGLGIAGLRHGASGLGSGSLIMASLVALLFWRILDHRLGGTGVQVTETILEGRTIQFLSQGLPYNNLWLMVVLIWIQTGFAMVIFSAAIKAVPGEFVEAAKVDGATDSSIFWRIIVPQIVPTVGVVVTTLIVTVLKVFDVVKVMTNGNFGSQVIANEMWFQAFTAGNQGLGSALAVVLFISVVPVVYFNIKRIQKGA